MASILSSNESRHTWIPSSCPQHLIGCADSHGFVQRACCERPCFRSEWSGHTSSGGLFDGRRRESDRTAHEGGRPQSPSSWASGRCCFAEQNIRAGKGMHGQCQAGRDYHRSTRLLCFPFSEKNWFRICWCPANLVLLTRRLVVVLASVGFVFVSNVFCILGDGFSVFVQVSIRRLCC